MTMRTWMFVAGVGVVGVWAGAAGAQSVPDYGFEWARIGAPGNRAANAQEAPRLFPPWVRDPFPIGSVGHEYRIATTEVTVGQWFDFVEAYAPYWTGNRGDPAFTGNWIWPTSTNPNEPPGYFIEPGAEHYPTDMSWRMAARYVNWLHNGKVNDRWAFESGVYDTSTFTMNPDGTINDQRTRSPGAKFWIPSLDEWTKAAHYDPDRYGPGQEGYWRYPHGSDDVPVPGRPETPGAETNAGDVPNTSTWEYFPVGSYPGTRSPWGLLDASGGMHEWTEWISLEEPRSRGMGGSRRADLDHDLYDRVDIFHIFPPWVALGGLRLASVIPAPGTSVIIGMAAIIALQNRRRT